jgi:phosphatidylglycerophosphate synthase
LATLRHCGVTVRSDNAAMLDRFAIPLLRPALNALAGPLVRQGVSANAITWLGFGLGVLAASCVAVQAFELALVLLLASRLCDALDGAVARATQTTAAGAFLDIALDFVFYALMVLGFALADPARNALPAAVLLTAFVGTGSSFLAFAVLAAQRGLHSAQYPQKSFYFLGGLTEATETLAVLVAMCIWPAYFAPLAWGFAALCAITWVSRIAAGWRLLGEPAPGPEATHE